MEQQGLERWVPVGLSLIPVPPPRAAGALQSPQCITHSSLGPTPAGCSGCAGTRRRARDGRQEQPLARRAQQLRALIKKEKPNN